MRTRVDESWHARVGTSFETLMARSNENKSWWELACESWHEFRNSHGPVKWEQELMRVGMRELARVSKLSWPGQMRTRIDESWHARVCTSFETLMAPSNENKSWWELACESWHEFRNSHGQVKWEQELMRVGMRELARVSKLSWLGQMRTRVDESWHARVGTSFETLMARSNENKSWWELACESLHEFRNSHGSVKWEQELMRVGMREFARVSKLSWLGQMRTRIDESWHARVCTSFETLMAPLNENKNWWELACESLHEFLNSHGPVKWEQELMGVGMREFARVSKLSWPGQMRTRIDESWHARVGTSF